jgi:hypothetical protein
MNTNRINEEQGTTFTRFATRKKQNMDGQKQKRKGVQGI